MTLLVFSHSFLLFFYCRSASPKDWVESARMSPSFARPGTFSTPPPPCRRNRHGGNLFQRRRPQRCTEPNFFSSACLAPFSPMPGNSSSTLSEMRLMRKLRVVAVRHAMAFGPARAGAASPPDD